MMKYLINFRYAFNLRKPLLFVRLCSTFLKIIFLKNEPLRYVDTQIGNKCNIRCKHCFANYYADDRGRMTPEQFGTMADDAMALGAVNFSFQGGEPLVYKDLCKYIEKARPERNVISVTTNGTLVTPEKCRELKGLGVDILTISIDDFRPLNYRDIMEKCLIAVRNGLKVTIGTVVSHENVHTPFMAEMIEFAQKHRMILVLILAAPVGEWDANQQVMLSDTEVELVKAWTRKYSYVRLDFDATYLYAKCPAGTEVLYLTSEGDVQSCPFIPRKFGNVKNQGIREIREKILASKVLRENRHICMVGEKQGTVLREMMEEGKNSDLETQQKEINV